MTTKLWFYVDGRIENPHIPGPGSLQGFLCEFSLNSTCLTLWLAAVLGQERPNEKGGSVPLLHTAENLQVYY